MAMKARMPGGPRQTITSLTVMVKAGAMWPTPVVTDSVGAGNRNLPGSKAHAGLSLTDVVTGGQAPRRQWATPAARDTRSEECSEAYRESRNGETRGKPLAWQVREDAIQDDWSTPTCRDKESLAKVTRGANATPGGTPLLVQVQQATWPTPQSYSAPEGQGKPTSTPLDQAARSAAGLPVQASNSKGGNLPASSVVLNPAWVSCLMGFPRDWCDIGDVPLPRSGTP